MNRELKTETHGGGISVLRFILRRDDGEYAVTTHIESHPGDKTRSTGVWIHRAHQFETALTDEGGCDVLPGKQCWGDGSYLAGDKVYDAWQAGGEEGLWRELENYYTLWENNA